ncbi:MAG: LptF/LptG family permease [Opitutales bacterium]|nr:LptF/LptG family permease [Opitutales bacterium]
MKLLNRYCFWGVTKRFCGFLLLLTVLLFLEDLYKHLEQFLVAHVTIISVCRYYLAHSVVLLPLTVPVAFLLAFLFFYGVMLRRQELIVCYASGISWRCIFRPMGNLALFLSLALLAGNLWLIPQAQSDTQAYIAHIHHGPSAQLRHLFFQNNEQLIYLQSYDPVQQRAENIVLNCYDVCGNTQRRIQADFAIFDTESQRWHFYRGKITHFDEHHLASKVQTFEEYASDCSVPPAIILAHNEAPQNLTLFQLKQLIDDPHTTNKAIYQMRCGDLAWNALLPLIFLWSGLPFLRLIQRRNFRIRVLQFLLYLIVLAGGSHLCTLIALHQVYPWTIGFFLPCGLTLLVPLFLFPLLHNR